MSKLQNVLVLTFHDGVKYRRLRLPNPRQDLTGKQVKACMDRIAETDYLWYHVEPKSAKIVQTETERFNITVD